MKVMKTTYDIIASITQGKLAKSFMYIQCTNLQSTRLARKKEVEGKEHYKNNLYHINVCQLQADNLSLKCVQMPCDIKRKGDKNIYDNNNNKFHKATYIYLFCTLCLSCYTKRRYRKVKEREKIFMDYVIFYCVSRAFYALQTI